jgi:VanZ family protein
MLARALRSEPVRRGCALVLPLALLALLIASTVRIEQPLAAPYSDKIEHALAFALLGVLTLLAHPRWPRLRAVLPALVGYGLFIECVQYGLPWREFSLLDWAADGAGALLAVVALRWLPGAERSQ